MLSSQISGSHRAEQVAFDSLEFLQEQSTWEGVPVPIGSNGWLKKGGKRALFDQQAIDVADMVLAYPQAFKLTKNIHYLDLATWWFNWFHGNNVHKICMVDEDSGAVLDGITKSGRNENRGAESIICYLLAYLSLSEVFLSEKIIDKE